jgi:plastocyanin
MNRRHYLRSIAASGLAAALSGCADDGGATPTPEPTATATPSPTSTEEETSTATPTETETETETATETATPTPEPPSAPDQRVRVGDGLRFDPGSFEVSTGGTVLWEWVGGGHNIKYDEGDVPAGTDWEGTAGSRTTTYGEGHLHWHTFEAPGEYRYYCVPHRGNGMTGRFTVVE